ncbi:hypothetical protein [Sphingomicrobium aestuariivivum]|uniref:hypothetical protein n=1 Tax=Sphingomicrobium aestuariivivum TaxID=1582356 RepID=UPI001FD6EFA2|nr:hypothetical protein [Sphingomicrobium aestuariivivum]MCJ8191615.1 hypothetical protein [Sphingomicrobium aestuariivivum]
MAAYGAALVLGLALHLALRRFAPRLPRWAVLLVPLLLAAPLVVGPEFDGARRWLALGPVTLQPALILLPLLLRAPTDGYWVAAMLLSAVLLVVQPDPGTFLALVAGVGLHRERQQRRLNLNLAHLSLVAVAILFARGEGQTVAFVENMVQSLPAMPLPALIACLLSMGFGAWALLAHRDGQAIAAFWTGALVASLVGPYPTPLIGLSASCMLGLFLSLPIRSRK